jgi:peptidoglycan/LPS O-acetylase OafA/YrhL
MSTPGVVKTADAPSAEDGSAPRKRIADIEALRAIAIVFVMVEHANFNLLFHPTLLLAFMGWGQLWPGVDLFFVISGFLVAGDLLRRLQGAGSGGFWRVTRRFWLRRAWRLWPVAWLWLALILVGSAVWTDPPFLGPFIANLRGTAAGVFLYANYRSVVTIWTPYGASFPYWSLSLEEQFYILLPFAMLVLGRSLPLAVVAAIAIQAPLAHGRLYFFFRSDALLWGVALALAHGTAEYRWCEPVFLRVRPLAALVVLGGLAALFLLAGPGNFAPPWNIGCIAAVSALLVWIATYDRDYICPRALRPLALWLGSRSYALYVAHMPMFLCAASLAHHVFTPRDHLFSGAGNVYALALVVPMLLGAVELTHRFVEQPLRRVGARIAGHSAAPA